MKSVRVPLFFSLPSVHVGVPCVVAESLSVGEKAASSQLLCLPGDSEQPGDPVAHLFDLTFESLESVSALSAPASLLRPPQQSSPRSQISIPEVGHFGAFLHMLQGLQGDLGPIVKFRAKPKAAQAGGYTSLGRCGVLAVCSLLLTRNQAISKMSRVQLRSHTLC